jgi:type II secretory pathway pseudopilin PulG
MAVMAVFLTVAVQSASFQAQREKEEELIFRGQQAVEAIRLFRARNGRFPLTLDELVKAKPRVLRKPWVDPMTGKPDWLPVYLGEEGGTVVGGSPAPTPPPAPRPTGRARADHRGALERVHRGDQSLGGAHQVLRVEVPPRPAEADGAREATGARPDAAAEPQAALTPAVGNSRHIPRHARGLMRYTVASMNGGPVLLVEPLPGAATAAVGAWIRSGSAHEPARLAGITHLLEHLLLRRCEAIAGWSVGGRRDRPSPPATAARSPPVGRPVAEAADLVLDALFDPRPLADASTSSGG